MAVKFTTLSNVNVVTDTETGVVTVSGNPDEKSMFSAAGQVLMAPFQVNDDTSYVTKSASAITAISWAAIGFHAADALHAFDGAGAKSPITGLFVS